MSINRVILLGNVGRDPEIRTLNNGDEVATLSLATSETWKDKATGERKETTEWHNVVVFNQGLIKVIREYVKKGSRIALEGKMKTRKWQDQNGQDRWTTEVVLRRFDGTLSLESQPQGARRDEHEYGSTTTRTGSYQSAKDSTSAASQDTGQTYNDLDDDIPF
jgi:single stranded DNA-binding protein (ssb)